MKWLEQLIPLLPFYPRWLQVLFYVAIGLLLVSIFFLLVLYSSASDKRKQTAREQTEAILLELAMMRRDAVALRNEGEKKELEGTALNSWVEKVREYQERMIDKAREFSPVEGAQLATLDRVQVLTYPHIKNPQQIRTLQNLSERIKRLDNLLDKHQPPAK